MHPRVVILGGGTGGTLVANRLQRLHDLPLDITVVDRDDEHVYQPGLLFVPFAMAEPSEIVRPRHAQLRRGVDFRLGEVESVDTDAAEVRLGDGTVLRYDVLVVATGAELQPQETEGLRWGESIHTFYTLPGAIALRGALRELTAGRLVVNIVDMPIKCPVAPLEFCFLADWWLRRRGVRENVQLTLATPLDSAFTKPAAAEHLAGMLSDKGIALEAEFAAGRVEQGRLISWDEREIGFELLVAIPAHGGPEWVGRSPGLGDELDFVPTDPHTLRARAAENVFVIGDASNVPTSKAGSVTHFEGETVVENVRRQLQGETLASGFDGHANCFIETGFHKAMLIDFDYEHEPLPGRFPDARLGPLALLSESRLNHIAKLAFAPLYWHVLLPGHDIPGVGASFQPPTRQPGGAR